MFARLAVLADHLTFGFAVMGCVGLLVEAIAICIDVLMRWMFNSPVHGMEDLNHLLIIFVVASFFPALLNSRGNITIAVLGRVLGKRGAEILNAFGHLVTLFFFVILGWQMVLFAGDLSGRITPILELPLQPVWWLAAVILVICIPVQGLVLVIHLTAIVTGKSIAGGRLEGFR